MLVDIAEYQFTLTSGIGGNNDFIALAEYLFDDFKLFEYAWVSFLFFPRSYLAWD